MVVAAGWTATCAAGTVGWRTDGTGLYPKAAPQTQWGPATRVLWATPLPQWSNALPVLVGERIFVCSEPNSLICLDRAGKILWQRDLEYKDLPNEGDPAEKAAKRAELEKLLPPLRAELETLRETMKQAQAKAKAAPNDAEAGKAARDASGAFRRKEQEERALTTRIEPFLPTAEWKLPRTHDVNGYTSNTPVSDGESIWVCYGSGLTACYALDGTRRWMRFVEKPTHDWGQSGSPVLAGDTLVVQFIDTFGLDARTGAPRWRVRHGHDWGTAAVFKLGKLDLLFTDGGEVVNAADGQTLVATGMRMEYGSPLVMDSVAYCASDKTAQAFKLALGADGKVTATSMWKAEVEKDRYYASPLLHDGLLYVVNQKGTLTVLDAATGAVAYSQKLNSPGTFYSSPVLAGNVILLSNERGQTVIIKPGRAYAEVSRVNFDIFRSTPICDGARMYIRTCVRGANASKLYCIGE
jgi:outer membrane protein assembly factor BamB